MTSTSSAPPSRPAAAVLLLVACLTIMVGCVVVPGLEQAAARLGVPAPSLLVTLPSLGVILGAPLSGWLIARRGAYLTLALGLAAYGALGAAGALLHGVGPVYADRLALGVATACVMTGGTTLIAQLWQAPAARIAMIARQGMAIELGGVVFLAVAGWLAVMDWRAPFALYLLAWPLLALQLLCVPRPGVQPAPAAGVPPAGRRPWGLYATAVASMLVFFTGVLTVPLLLGAPGGAGLDSAGIGLFLAFVSLVAVAAASQMPRAVRLMGGGTFVLAFACYGAAFVLFALNPPFTLAVMAGLLMGCGFGLSVPTLNHEVIARSSPTAMGPRLALLALALFLGQFLAAFAEFLPGGATSAFAGAAIASILTALAHLAAVQRLSRSQEIQS